MKKSVIVVLLLIFVSILMAQNDLMINGSNNLNYIYRSRSDSLNSYFDDEFGFNLVFGKFSYGMEFISQMPRYSNYTDNQYLTSGDVYYKWAERYIAFETSNFYALGGTFEKSFGSGIILSTTYDKDFEIDTRLTGSLLELTAYDTNLKATYGVLQNESNKNENDLVLGMDLEKNIKCITFAATAISYRKKHNNKFFMYNIAGGRLNISTDIFEMSLEGDKLKEVASRREMTSVPAKDGRAIFGTANLYFDKFSFMVGYKNFDDFNIYINDPPRLNHSDEPLSENQKAGEDEQGFQGEISFIPTDKDNMVLNYSEAWNKDKTIKLSDTYAKYEHTFDENILGFEFAKTERYEEVISEWTNEMTPTISYDTSFNNFGVHIKSEYKIKKKVHNDDEITEYEPLLQTDFSYNDISFSVITVYPFEKKSTGNKFWIGTELKTPIFSHTNLTFFAGKEKGRKVCRNGVCKYQSTFEGIKLNLTTNF